MILGVTSSALLANSGPVIDIPAATMFYDSFTGVDYTNLTAHNMETGQTWTVTGNGFIIHSNGIIKTEADSVRCYAVMDAGSTTATITTSYNHNGAAAPSGIMVRYLDDNNYYLVKSDLLGNGLQIIEVAGGVFTTKAFKPSAPSDELKVIVSGNEITAINYTVGVPIDIVHYNGATLNSSSTKYGLTIAYRPEWYYHFKLWTSAGLPPLGPYNPITVETPSPSQIFQRTSGNNGTIKIRAAVYNTGGTVSVEARFKEGSWTTIATGVQSTFQADLPNQSGQGLLELRVVGDPSRYVSVANVGIGDIYVIAGQSNASGMGDFRQVYSHATLRATMFGNSYNWLNLLDFTDDATKQVDTVSSDSGAGGSYWPYLATSIMANRAIPVAFIPTAKGATSISLWQPGVDHLDRSTLYGSMHYRAKKVGPIKAVLFHQGESDATVAAPTDVTVYKNYMKALADAVMSDLGVPLVVARIHQWGAVPATTQALVEGINQAMANAAAENTNVKLGPNFHEPTDFMMESSQDLHFRTSAHMQEAADRWWAALNTLGI